MAAAPAAAELPAAVYFAIGLAALLAYCIARGLLASWTHTLGYIFQWLSHELSFRIPTGFGHVSIDLGGPFATIDYLAVTALQAFAHESEHLSAYFFHGAAKMTEWAGHELAMFAVETYHFGEWVVHAHVPKTVTNIIRTTLPVAVLERMVSRYVLSHLPNVGRLERTIEAWASTEIHRLVRAAGAIALPAPWAFPSFRRWAHDIAQWRKVTAHRLRRLEELLAASGLALAVARMLGVPNYRCLTRGNISRLSRALCGLDKALIDLLLLGTVEAFVAADLCEFTKLLTAAAKQTVPLMLALVDVENELVGCSGMAPLAAMGLPALSLPSVGASSLLGA